MISGALQHSVNVRSWIKSNRRLLSIAGTILSIVHPDQYNVGMTVLDQIRRHPEKVSNETFFKEILEGWGCPFTEFIVTSNHKISLYRSIAGRGNWLDILLSFGQYEGGYVVLPDIKANFEYQTGTAIVMCVKILRHTVERTTSGDRMSFRFSVRENMAKWLDLKVDNTFSQYFM